jgi:hypothetical protein
MGKHEPVDRH